MAAMLSALILSTALTISQAESSGKTILLAPAVPAEVMVPASPRQSSEPRERNDTPYPVYDAGRRGFAHRLIKAYCDDRKKMREQANGNGNGNDKDNGNGQGEENGKNAEPPRRAMPSPFE